MDKKQNIDITGFVIKGKKFTNQKQFLFWENEKLINLIYGTNAEGKSSICNIIRECFILNNSNESTSATLYSEKTIDKSESKKIKFFIFNDKYVDRFINRGDKGLKPFFPDEGFYNIFEEEYNKIFEKLNTIKQSSDKKFPSILWNWTKINKDIHKGYCSRRKKIKEKTKEFFSCNDKNNHYDIIKKLMKHRSGYEDSDSLEAKITKSVKLFEQKLESETSDNIDDWNELNFRITNYENWYNIYHFGAKISSLQYLYLYINKYISDFIEFIQNEKSNINSVAFVSHLTEIKNIYETLIPIFETENLSSNKKIDLSYINSIFLVEKLGNDLFILIFTSLKELEKNINNILKKLENLPKSNEITKLVNNGISYILRGNHHLKINHEIDKNNYVNVNKKEVEFKDLSTSEKNMLALVYFLASLWNNMNIYINLEGDPEALNYIIMIDDPVSSFDQDYKENISNYFIYVIHNIIKLTKKSKKNAKKINAKFAIFTHDINIYRLFKNNFKSIGDFANIINYKTLKNKVLLDDDKDVLVYSKTIQKIYNFIVLEEQNGYTNIGNDVRRVLEFFLLHYRNKVFNDIKDSELKNEFYEKKHEKLFDTIKFRNLTKLLHIESHENENLFNMDFNYLREPEYYKNLAKELFCFIHVIDDRHIISHLKYREKCKCEDNIKCKDCKCNFKCDPGCECKEKCKSKTKKSEYIKKEELDLMINEWIQNLELMSLKEEEIKEQNILFFQKNKSFN